MGQYSKELLTYTEKSIFDIERPKNVGLGLDMVFDSPISPMLVFNMTTTQSEADINYIRNNLFSIWPHYKDVIPFISNYKSFNIQETMQNLMDSTTGFVDYSEIRLYFIIDTSETPDSAAFYAKINEIKAIKDEMAHFSNPRCILFLMFAANKPNSKEIRSSLTALYDGDHFGLDLVVLVSNQLRSGAFVTNDRERTGELVSVILLSNGGSSSELKVLGLDGFKVVTVNALHQEKAYSDISQVIINRIFLKIQELIRNQNYKFDIPGFLEKIGINSVSHYFELFERRVTDSVIDESTLYLFPVNGPDKSIDINLLSYDDFNQVTFCTLEAYLKKLIGSSEFFDAVVQERMVQEYREYLYKNFTLWELNSLQGHVEQLESEYLAGVRSNVDAGSRIVERVDFKYKSGVSTEPRFYSIFFDELKKLCDNAQNMSESINELINEIGALRPVRDETICKYYQYLTDEYIRDHPSVLSDLLRVDILQLADIKTAFINKIKELIAGIIATKSDVFSLPYVEELQVRLSHTSNEPFENVIKREVIDRDDNMSVFFKPEIGSARDLKTIFGKPPILLINSSNDLKKIADSVDYTVINTKSNSFIEKIDLFRIEKENI